MPSRRLVFAALIVGIGAGAVLTLVLVDRLLRLDSQAVATGVTLAATIATTAATIALAWFGRLQIVAAGRQQHGVAAALLEEVKRIRTELGARPRDGEAVLVIDSHTADVPPDRAAIVTDAELPTVHEWFRPVISQAAESDPAIVGGFLTLDRRVATYRERVNRLVAAQQELAGREANWERWIEAHPDALQDPLFRPKVEDSVNSAQRSIDAATADAVFLYRTCHETLDELEKALRAVR